MTAVSWLSAGGPFALTLLSILGVHEFGHYFTARYYHASVSLPYFIPAPPPLFLFGTLGAIIRMRSPARDRNSLFDIAAAGPLAGMLIVPNNIYRSLSIGAILVVVVAVTATLTLIPAVMSLLGDKVDSWLGDGPNKPVEPRQITSAVGDQKLASLASVAGISAKDAA